MKKLIVANTLSQLIGRAISALTTLVVTVFIARNFGADGYGDFVKITTYTAFFYLIADFGMNAIFLQYEESKHWASLVALRLLVGSSLILLSLIILAFLPGTRNQGYTPVVKIGILLFCPTILFQSMIITANAVFQKHLQYTFAAWAIFFGSLATIISIFFATSSLMGVGIVAFGSLVTAVFSLWFAAQILGRLPFVPSTASMKKLFVSSVPLGVILLFSLVYFRADSVIITLTRPTAEVGVYGLAYKVFEVILVFPTFFMNAVYPIMLHKKNIENILRNSFLFLLITSFISLVALWFLSPLLVFIKSDFVASVGALRVLTLGLPFFFVTSATMWGLIAMKKQKILVSIYGISMAINLIGNIVLIPTHGFMAAAWMTVVGEGVVLFLSSIVLLKTLNNNKEYLKFSIFNF